MNELLNVTVIGAKLYIASQVIMFVMVVPLALYIFWRVLRKMK